MKKVKLLILPLMMLSLFFSCSDNDSNSEFVEPFKPKAKLKLEVQLNLFVLEDAIDGEVISKVDYNMSNVASLIYVVHKADDGSFVKFMNIDKEMLSILTKNQVTTLYDDNLPLGKYYITLIVTTQDKLDSSLLKSLALEYSKAACQVPNNHIYYKTMQVDCMPTDGTPIEYLKEDVEFKVQTWLDLITGEFIFLLPKGSKGIPEKAKFSMTAEITNLPSAFFIKSGKTLNNKEVEEMKMYKYNDKFEITSRFDKQLVAKYYLLANHELEDKLEERGNFLFIYKEDASSDMITRRVDIKLPERKQTEFHFDCGHTYMYDLYSTKKAITKINSKPAIL